MRKVLGVLLLIAAVATLISAGANMRSYAAERNVHVAVVDPQDAYIGVKCKDYVFECCCKCCDHDHDHCNKHRKCHCDHQFTVGVVWVTNNMDANVYARLEDGWRWRLMEPGETGRFVTLQAGEKLVVATFDGGSARITCYPETVIVKKGVEV